MTKLFVIFGILFLLNGFCISQQEQHSPEENDKEPDVREGVVGLYKNNKKALSKKDEIEADHFMPQSAVKNALKECGKKPSCKNSLTFKKLEKMMKFDLTVSLTPGKDGNHGKTPSFCKPSPEIEKLLLDGNFEGAFSKQIEDYHSGFDGKKIKPTLEKAISEMVDHYKEAGILEEHEYENLLDKHGEAGLKRVSQNNSPMNRKSMAHFKREISKEQQTPEEKRGNINEYGGVARAHIKDQAASVRSELDAHKASSSNQNRPRQPNQSVNRSNVRKMRKIGN